MVKSATVGSSVVVRNESIEGQNQEFTCQISTTQCMLLWDTHKIFKLFALKCKIIYIVVLLIILKIKIKTHSFWHEPLEQLWASIGLTNLHYYIVTDHHSALGAH